MAREEEVKTGDRRKQIDRQALNQEGINARNNNLGIKGMPKQTVKES